MRSTSLDDVGRNDVGHDAAGRLTQWRHLAPGGTLVAGYEYRYDRTGLLASERQTHRPLGTGAFGRVFHYDSAGNTIAFEETTLDASHAVVGPLTYGEQCDSNAERECTRETQGGPPPTQGSFRFFRLKRRHGKHFNFVRRRLIQRQPVFALG